jgi:hypothetical protein
MPINVAETVDQDSIANRNEIAATVHAYVVLDKTTIANRDPRFPVRLGDDRTATDHGSFSYFEFAHKQKTCPEIYQTTIPEHDPQHFQKIWRHPARNEIHVAFYVYNFLHIASYARGFSAPKQGKSEGPPA